MATTDTAQITPTHNAGEIRPASCTPTKRHELRPKQDKASPSSTTPQVNKGSRSRCGRSRTRSADGENGAIGSTSKKKMTGAVGGGGGGESPQSKKMDALLMAKFEKLSDIDRVRRVKVNSDRIMKVCSSYM